MIRLQRNDLHAEGDRRGAILTREDSPPPEWQADEAIRLDADELRWLTLTGLPAILAAPAEDEPLHPGGKAATVTDGQAHQPQEDQP